MLGDAQPGFKSRLRAETLVSHDLNASRKPDLRPETESQAAPSCLAAASQGPRSRFGGAQVLSRAHQVPAWWCPSWWQRYTSCPGRRRWRSWSYAGLIGSRCPAAMGIKLISTTPSLPVSIIGGNQGLSVGIYKWEIGACLL